MDNKKDNTASEEQKNDRPLFRKEALEYKKGSALGKTVIISPISFSLWTLGISLVAIALGLFLYFGKYAKRQDANGILVPTKGLIHIYSSTPTGIITQKFVNQGDKVTKGQALYTISTERHALSMQGEAAQEIALLEKQIAVQKNRLETTKKMVARYKQLIKQHYVTEIEYQKYYDEYLQGELHLNQLQQQLNKAKLSGDYTVVAPSDGTITSLVAMVGDRVTQDKILASIIPSGAMLQGVLFVPTKVIGTVKPGQKVLLKYDAFPYQNFGLHESTVVRIDKSILTQKDIDVPFDLRGLPFYRVIVALKQQTIMVYGKPQYLTAGMTLQGSILGDQRYIWQWILDPIYSLRGSLLTHE